MPSVKIKKLFGLLVLVGSVLVAPFMQGGFFMPEAASAADIIEVDDFCDTQGSGGGPVVTTRYKSPYSKTEYLCLGSNTDINVQMNYYQFALKFKNAVSDATVSGKNGRNDPIYFVQQNDTTFVSIPGPQSASHYQGSKAGYGAGTVVSGTTTCNQNDGLNKITLTARGNYRSQGNQYDQQVINFNLCDYTRANQTLIEKEVNQVNPPGANINTGNVIGRFGVERPETDTSRGDNRRMALMERDGITYIRLKKDGQVVEEDRNGQGAWFNLANGEFSMTGTPTGEYELVISYDDRPVASKNGYPYDPEEPFTFVLSFTVRAGQTTTITSGAGVHYFTAADDGVDPTSLGIDESSDEPVCSAGSFGWLLCPLVDGLANLNDAAFSIIQGLLQSNPLHDPSTGTDNDTYRIWGAMRDIANVILVIGFIMIIFSQATSVGISNYGIKKLLPKLVAVAILINASWIVMQIATDLANILGSGLYQLLTALAPEINVDWGGFLAGVIGGGLAATGGFFAVSAAGGLAPAMWLILPPVIAAALALVVGVLTLFIRQALIIILVVLSPIAIACFLLPGTEQWFKRWQKLLISMLMMYPLAALVFGGAQLAAGIITPERDMHSAYQLVALIILALPLFSLPWLAKQGGEILGKVNGALGKLASGASKPVGNFAKEKSELAKERNLATPPRTAFGNKVAFARRHAQNMDRRKKMRELEINAFKAQRADDFNQSVIDSNLADDKRFQATPGAQRYLRSTAAKAESEQLKAAVDAMRIDPSVNTGDRDELKKVFKENIVSTNPADIIKAKAAAHLLMQARGGDKIRDAISELGDQFTPSHGSLLASTLLSSDNSSITFDTTPDMFKWASAGGTSPLSNYTQDPGSYRLSAAAMSKASGGTLENIAKAPTTDDREAAKQLIQNQQFMGQKSVGDQISIYKIAGIPEDKMPAGIRQAAAEAAAREAAKRQQAAQAGAGPISVNVSEPTQGEIDLSGPTAQTPPAPPQSYIDDQGRQTPGNIGDSDDYHDGMQR